jgi:hypothetical protein
VDLGELVGGVKDVGGDGRAGLANALRGAVVQRVVGVVLLIRRCAVGDLGEAVEFVVAVGVVDGDAVDGFGLACAVADAVVAVVVLAYYAAVGVVDELGEAAVGVVLIVARGAVGEAFLDQAVGGANAESIFFNISSAT